MGKGGSMQRFANDGQRFILWLLQDGCCAHCARPLEYEEADHIVTFAEGGRTTLDNLELLCPMCHQEKTRQDIVRIRAQRRDAMGFVRRQGQEAWKQYVETHPNELIFPGRFPTGYGKTEILLDGYASLRASQQYNRLLVIVPTDQQATQYINELERKARRMGLAITGVVPADGTTATLRYHCRDRAEVFVATIQRIVLAVKGMNRAGNWITDLLATGSWLGAADEYHHYADENGGTRSGTTLAWGDALRKLTQIRQWMAVSATPERKIGTTIFGAPVVSISYADGLQEGKVLKDVAIRVRDYSIDIQMDQGQPRQVTTTELREEIGTDDIDTWETRRQLRYLTQYSSPILIHAFAELSQLMILTAQMARPQMLIYTHSCASAEALAELCRALAPGFAIDWVGTGGHGRSDAQNQAIIDAFTDSYADDGQIIQEHTMDVLVQVNKAGEGFDSKPVSVVVDLSLHGFGPQKLQQYGRGTRYYHGLPLVIYVPTDSAIAGIADLRAGIFDLPVDTVMPSGTTRTTENNGLWEPLPKLHVLDAQLIGGHDYDPTPDQIFGVAQNMSEQLSWRDGIRIVLDPENNPDDYELIKNALTSYNRQSHLQQSTVAAKKLWSERVTWAVGRVAQRLVVILYNGVFDKRIHVQYIRLLHKQWGQQRGYTNKETAIDDDYHQKYNWLSDLDALVLQGEIPTWIPIY